MNVFATMKNIVMIVTLPFSGFGLVLFLRVGVGPSVPQESAISHLPSRPWDRANPTLRRNPDKDGQPLQRETKANPTPKRKAQPQHKRRKGQPYPKMEGPTPLQDGRANPAP